MYPPVPLSKITRVQSGIVQLFGLLNSSVNDEDVVHESDRR